ncbi:MAG: NADH-quinone oxidoreductase subunit L [Rhodobacterales bacterium]|nr:MAG: NADH-quinone oxidoreductase subunit L [Rhodobacterales bacterium]
MLQIILCAPLLAAVIAGFGASLMGEKPAQILTTSVMFVVSGLSWVLLWGSEETVQHIFLVRFVESGYLTLDWGLRLDRLTAVMLVLVSSISALVHLYSFGYMPNAPHWKKHQPYKARFFAYLSFATFAMLVLVTADNLLQMLLGWQALGIGAYLLTGFYYRKPGTGVAASRVFVTNRVGDFTLLLAMILLLLEIESLNLDDITLAAPDLARTTLRFLALEWNAAGLIGALLLIAALSKAAQLFLHIWLPDAMQAPTPAAALICATSMGTAGVFLLLRLAPLIDFAPQVKTVMLVMGASTALFAASIAQVQNDIKRALAYGLCVQLGYVFVVLGLGVYPAALNLLLAQTLFNALLFLSAGSVIRAMQHQQDIRHFGGLRRKMPLTLAMTLIGTLIGTLLVAGMSSYYSWRLVFLTFFGKPRGEAKLHEPARESPLTMQLPMIALALAVIAVPIVLVSPALSLLTGWAMAAPFAMPLLGGLLAWVFYIRRPTLPKKLAKRLPGVHRFLLKQWYFEALYNLLLVRPVIFVGNMLWQRGEDRILGGGADGIGLGLIPFLGKQLGPRHGGALLGYALLMVLGVVGLIIWAALIGEGAHG